MICFALALGSNQGDRLQNLTKAHQAISRLGTITATSPIFENPPLMPEFSVRAQSSLTEEQWHASFFNAALFLKTTYSPQELIGALKSIEHSLGRNPSHPIWAPRTIDIDILAAFDKDNNELKLTSTSPFLLQLPHPRWQERAFVSAPLFTLPTQNKNWRKQICKIHRAQKQKLSLIMGIHNVTPDSLAGPALSSQKICENIESQLKSAVAYIDIGAESTRPNATPLTSHEELPRLCEIFEHLPRWKSEFPFSQFSIDTRHAETAQKALDCGFDILNDVSGLTTPDLREVAKNFSSVVLMHSLSVPADPKKILPEGTDVLSHLKNWREQKISELLIPEEKIIFDPGLGFGLSKIQSLEVLKNIEQLIPAQHRILIGASRKSFMSLWTHSPPQERDIETLTTSLHLNSLGVDILRVHNTEIHQRALRARNDLHNT